MFMMMMMMMELTVEIKTIHREQEVKVRPPYRYKVPGWQILLRLHTNIQGGPKKVSQYQESSLNRIKNRQCGYISRQFYYN